MADESMQLSSSIHHAFGSPCRDWHDRVRHLNIELHRVVTRIREIPGLSHSLLPSLFTDLQRAACGGPVIIPNASQYSCGALILPVHQDPIDHHKRKVSKNCRNSVR